MRTILEHAFYALLALLFLAGSVFAQIMLPPVPVPPPSVVSLPGICRESSSPISIPTNNPATVQFVFPTNGACAFSVAPTCNVQISATDAAHAFDYPLNTSADTTQSTFSITEHSSSLGVTVSLPETLSVTTAPAPNATAIITCTAPPA